jgi:hypothetical protein
MAVVDRCRAEAIFDLDSMLLLLLLLLLLTFLLPLQVDGCGEDLSELKPYFRRSKICPSHQAAPTVLLGGVVCRFCQQCTRCHPLDEFDGTKRCVCV